MKIINLPSRGLTNKLIPVKQEGKFNVYSLDTEIKLNGGSIYSIHFNPNGSIYAIDPDSGPFMGLGFKINNMILDHIDDQHNLYFINEVI